MYNRRTDTQEPEKSDVIVSTTARLVTRLIGTLVLLCVTIGFFYPTLFINIWPWTLTPLTARVLCGWLSVIGTGAIMISLDPRWTAWRAILEGIFLAYSLIFVAAFMNPSDFINGIFNWYTVLMGIMLVSILIFYFRMEKQRSKSH